MNPKRPYHNAEQEQAWLAVEATLQASTDAHWAAKEADRLGDDANYPRLLAESLRADREFEGAWAHYHRI